MQIIQHSRFRLKFWIVLVCMEPTSPWVIRAWLDLLIKPTQHALLKLVAITSQIMSTKYRCLSGHITTCYTNMARVRLQKKNSRVCWSDVYNTRVKALASEYLAASCVFLIVWVMWTCVYTLKLLNRLTNLFLTFKFKTLTISPLFQL